MKKILLSIAIVGSFATQAMASHAENVKAELAFERAAAAKQEEIADGLMTRDEAVRDRLVEKHSCSAALRGARVDIDTYESIGKQRFHLPTRAERDELQGQIATLVEKEAAMQERLATTTRQVEICRGLTQILAGQIHREDPTYGPTINFDDPRTLEELLEKVRGMRIRTPQPATTCDGDFEVLSSADLRH